MTQVKSYASFNNVTFQGRVFDATVANGQYGEFVAVTIITNLEDGDEGVTVTFNNSNGLLALTKKGFLQKGRQVHVTGRMVGVSETYTDKKTGELVIRKRPQVALDSKTAQLTLGASPKSDTPQRATAGTRVIRREQTQAPAVDDTPTFGDNAVAEEGAF